MKLVDVLDHQTHELEWSHWGPADKPETIELKCLTCDKVVLELHDAGDGDVVLGPIKEFETDGKDPSIVLEGNLSEGFRAHGPFNTFDEAADYANVCENMTWVMHLE